MSAITALPFLSPFAALSGLPPRAPYAGHAPRVRATTRAGTAFWDNAGHEDLGCAGFDSAPNGSSRRCTRTFARHGARTPASSRP